MNSLTESSFFMTVVAQTLHRILREDDLLFTSITSGRMTPEMQSIIGMFVQTLPVISHASSDTVIETMQKMQEQYIQTQANSIMPYTCLVEKYGVKSEIMFVYQGEAGTIINKNAEDAQYAVNTDTAMFPLLIQILHHDDSYVIEITYDTTLYNQQDITLLANTIRTFAENIMTEADIPISRIALVSPEEREKLHTLNYGGELSYNHEETFVDILRHQAQISPEKTFIVFKERSFTYREIDEITDRLAAHLVSLGLKHEEAVGVMIDRSELMFIYSMGVMKAGGTYMPLDSHFPEERLRFMCEDAKIKIILADDGLVQKILPLFTGIIFEKKQLMTLTSSSISILPIIKPSDRMVILYTSGSTGKPKGVELEQHSLVNFCHAYADYINLSSNDRVVAYANYGFDAHMLDMYPPMLVGASLYILPEAMRYDLAEIYEYLETNGITVGFITSVIATQMVSLYPSTTLRVFSCGGEKMPAVTSPGNYRFINFYGPTEISIAATCYDVRGYFAGEYIGQPLSEYHLYVVDKYLNEVPDGVTGELLIAGTGIARGYLNRPDLTAEKFIDFNGERAYRSGDLVRWSIDPRDGSRQLEYLGRIDKQVKLRGLRIELGEIENCIASYPAINQVCIEVREIGGQPNLVCYYTEKTPVDIDALKSFIGKTLTAFMIPEFFVRLDVFPFNQNGKIDRKALPTPDLNTGIQEIIPPATEMEHRLFDITSALLQCDQFGVTTNLLSVGLTSLSAMRLSSQVKIQLGLSLPFSAIMKTPTVHELAHLLTTDSDTITNEQIATVHDVQEYYPLTENQRGLYIDWEMNRTGIQYNIPSVKSIQGYTAEQLQEALTMVVNAHPILKMRLVMKDGEVMQHRRDNETIPCPIYHLQKIPESDFFQSRVHPFDLFNDDLCRIEIYTYEDKVWLFTDIHHIIYDGGSTFIFDDDTSKVLHGEPVTKETYTAYDRSLDEQEMHTLPLYKKAETYFASLMSQEYEVARYPHSSQLDENSSPSLETGIQAVSVSLNRQAIRTFCQMNSLTENSFFMTVVAQTLHRILREDDLLFTSITSGRMTPEMQSIIGMFVQTLPVISHASSDTVIETMQKMQEQYIQTQTNSIMPYTRLVEKYGVKSEIMFVYQGEAETIINKNTGNAQYAVKNNTALFPLLIQILPHDDSYVIEITYDTTLYNQQDITLLANTIRTFAENIMTEADIPISRIALVNSDEREKLHTLNYGGELSYNHEETFVDILRHQAQISPEKTFIVFKERSFTYREIDEITDRLATYLVSLGLKHEEAVGVMIERSELMFIYSMGVMKAGGTYMPLDSHFPEERLMFMCEDAKIKIILADDGLVQKILPSFTGIIFEKKQLMTLTSSSISILPIIKPSDRMVILYTSGSTGKPKGVELEQHSLVNFCHAYADYINLSSNDRVVAYANYGFDVHMLDIYPPMLVGATLYILPEAMRYDLAEIHEYLETNGITVGFMTSVIATQMVSLFPSTTLRIFIGAGEKMPAVNAPDTYRFINLYGPTETSVGATCYDVRGYFVGEYIGQPLSEYHLYVVDKFLNEVTDGVAGELLIAGTCVARGYLNRPDLTAEKFIDFNGERAYRSGDLVRWSIDPRDGSRQLEFLGRIDKQVKLRGLRIELGEIENCIASYPAINQVCIEVREIGGQPNLVCYYTEKTPVDIDSLKSFIGKTLTAFMIPEFFVRLDVFPFNQNGKIDRKALPNPEIKIHTHEMVSPATSREQILLTLAHTILKRTDFGVTDELRSFGLTSLSAIQLVARAKQENITIKVSDVMRLNTIREVLQKKQGIGEWFEPYQEGKPILVFVSGIYAVHFNVPRLNRLSSVFNIFTIESLDEHYAYVFNQGENIDDIATFYLDLLNSMLPSEAKIRCFMGFSLGGILAYEMAQKYYQMTGTMTKVVLGDSEASQEKQKIKTMSESPDFETEKQTLTLELHRMYCEMGSQDDDALKIRVEGEVQLMIHRFDIGFKVYTDYQTSVFPADILFFNTLRETKPSDFIDRWKQRAHSVVVVDINDTHNAFCLDMSHRWLDTVCNTVLAFLTEKDE